MPEIKAIETTYNGYRFRSRLEARWAVFFDALGVRYEYEPEGFDLGDGIYYLPDFLIHNVVPRYAQGDSFENIYVEVKGTPNAVDAEKIYRFSEHHPIWVVGALPDPDRYVDSCEAQRNDFCNAGCGVDFNFDFKKRCVFCPYDHGTIDGDSCFAFSLAYDYGTLSFHGADSSYEYGRHDPEIENALRKARQARFEHGETPR